MNSAPSFTREQLAAARTTHWHQHGEPLLTLEAARDFLQGFGLVLFAPRAQQLPAPAPSLVEATLGQAEAAPSAAQSDTARSLVARLTAEGSAVPLNLLGSPGDAPDFVVSAAAFPYIFTLRGDKLWKQPPVNAGAIKVSPLASGVYEKLAAGEALTAAELAAELGREVTEAAIVRSLNELWSQLRVLPLLQQDGSATRWELTTRRFTKAIKQGANAGQPTALSALISLYLAQSYAATEDEVEVFLSPLTARSRVRDVLHGLTGARQLDEIVLDGKTNLYIPGTIPEFPSVVAEEAVAVDAGGAAEAPAQSATGTEERIRRFDGPRAPRESRPPRGFGDRGNRGARPQGRGDRADRPDRGPRTDRSARPASTGRSAAGDRGARPSRPFVKREGDRPFRKPAPYRETPTRSFGSAEGDAARPARSFRKPEDRGERPARPARTFEDRGERPARPARKFEDRGERPARPARSGKPFGKPAFDRGSSSKPRFERSSKPGFDRKPGGTRFSSGSGKSGDREGRSSFSDRERRPFQRDRAVGSGGPERANRTERSERPARPPFARPWDEDRKPRARRDEGDRAERPQRSEADRDRKRSSGSSGFSGEKRVFRSSGSRPGGAKPKFGAKRPPFKGKREGEAAAGARGPKGDFPSRAAKKPFSPGQKRRTSGGSKPFGSKPFRGTSGAGGRKSPAGKGRPFSPVKKRKPKSDSNAGSQNSQE